MLSSLRLLFLLPASLAFLDINRPFGPHGRPFGVFQPFPVFPPVPGNNLPFPENNVFEPAAPFPEPYPPPGYELPPVGEPFGLVPGGPELVPVPGFELPPEAYVPVPEFVELPVVDLIPPPEVAVPNLFPPYRPDIPFRNLMERVTSDVLRNAMARLFMPDSQPFADEEQRIMSAPQSDFIRPIPIATRSSGSEPRLKSTSTGTERPATTEREKEKSEKSEGSEPSETTKDQAKDKRNRGAEELPIFGSALFEDPSQPEQESKTKNDQSTEAQTAISQEPMYLEILPNSEVIFPPIRKSDTVLKYFIDPPNYRFNRYY